MKIYLFALNIFCTSVFADNVINNVDFQEILFSEYQHTQYNGKKIVSGENEKTKIVEICFDVCDYFKWNKKSDPKKIWNFIFLFEISHGVGTENNTFMNSSKISINTALSNSNGFCKKVDEPRKLVECNWKAYSQSLDARIGFVQYDEGNRCFVWKNTDTLTSIASTQVCTPIDDYWYRIVYFQD